MINQARRGANDAVGVEGTPHVIPNEDEKGVVDVQTRLGHVKITRKMVSLTVAAVVGVVLLNVQTVDSIEASRCFAVLVFCTIMWATEVRLLYLLVKLDADWLTKAIPLFVTSLSVYPFFS